MTDFGTVVFSNATVDGRPISAYGYNQVDMKARDGILEAITSTLDDTGEYFWVTWNSRNG